MKDAEGGFGGADLQLTQDGGHITGSTGASKDHAWLIENAMYADNHLTFHVTSTDPESKEKSEWTFDLKVDGDRMTRTRREKEEMLHGKPTQTGKVSVEDNSDRIKRLSVRLFKPCRIVAR